MSDLAGPPSSPPPPEPLNDPQPPRGGMTERLRSLEFRAGLLLVLMALLLATSALYLMWVRGAFEATQALYLSTDDSEGVSVGMDLTFSGFPIGRVSRIELADQGEVRIRVEVPVKSAHWLRTSSVFTLEKGLVGAARLRAFTGVFDDPPLPPDSERTVLRGDVTAEIPRMVADARDVLQNVKRITDAESELSAAVRQLSVFAGRINSAKGGFIGALTGNEADARRMGELLERSNTLLKNLDSVAVRVDGVVKKADQQMLGQDGLVPDAQAAVRQLNALLTDVRATMVQVDGVLKEVQGVASNTREATDNLQDLRGDVESSLRKIDSLMTEINRKWPFAPKEKEVKLP